jgi:uncharacterized protein (TIGR02268 family)
LSSLPATLLACALLAAPEGHAQPEEGPWAAQTRRIVLEAQRVGSPPEVRISPGVSTVLLFDSSLARVELPSRARFERVGEARDMLILIPSSRVEDGERLALTVHFADGAVPTSADLLLVVHPSLSERQVEVYRHPRTADSLRAELAEKEDAVRRCQGDVARLQAAQAQPDGLVGLWAAGAMNWRGVAASEVTDTLVGRPRNALRVARAWAYRASSRVAVELHLDPGPVGEPWRAEGATLTGKAGATLRVLRVWQLAPGGPDEEERLMVEAEATDATSAGPYTLTVWSADGKRSVILSNLMFP